MREQGKRFKPQEMVGDLTKDQCEFTSDLNYIALNSRLNKKKMKEAKLQESESL